MLYPDTQTRLQLIREQQAMLQQQARSDRPERDDEAQTIVRETRTRRHWLRLDRLRRSFRPAAHPS